MSPVVLSLTDAITFDSISPSFLGRGRTLADVMVDYGYLDRAFPDGGVFAASINRLGRAGMIVYASGRFKATPLGKRIAKRYRKPARGMIASTVRLGRAWEGTAVEEIVPSFEFVLDDAEYKKAVGSP